MYITCDECSTRFGSRFCPNCGKKYTDVKKGKYKGEENSQYGTCWVFNLTKKETKKIKSIDLDVYLKKGWVKGRKMKF